MALPDCKSGESESISSFAADISSAIWTIIKGFADTTQTRERASPPASSVSPRRERGAEGVNPPNAVSWKLFAPELTALIWMTPKEPITCGKPLEFRRRRSGAALGRALREEPTPRPGGDARTPTAHRTQPVTVPIVRTVNAPPSGPWGMRGKDPLAAAQR